MTKIPVASAKMANVQRSTLYRKNEKGDISFEKDASGNNVIDVSELLRIYPNATVDASSTQHNDESQKQQIEQEETIHNTALLEQEIKFLREKLKDKEEQLGKSEKRENDLSQKLDQIIANAAEEKVLLLEDHRDKTQKLEIELEELKRPPENAVEPPKRFLGTSTQNRLKAIQRVNLSDYGYIYPLKDYPLNIFESNVIGINNLRGVFGNS